MGNSYSPEEKLLRLIKGQKSATPKSTPSPPEAKQKPQPKTLASPFLWDNFQRAKKFFTVNRSINIAFILAGIYLAVSLLSALRGYKNVELPLTVEDSAAGNPQASARESEPKGGKLPFDYYSQATGARSIFVREAPEFQARAESAINDEAIKDINIVGIIADSNPQVIIEDRKTQKTHYVSKGQSIGEFMVEEIQDGKVILNRKGERFELYL